MSFQTVNTIASRTNQPNTPFGRYNNTYEEVFGDVRWQVGPFFTTAVSRIYGANQNAFSSKQLADYIRDNQLTVNWSVIPGIDAIHHCFLNGPWNSPHHQLVCDGPTLDVPLNQTSDSFQRFVMSSLGYDISDSSEVNFLNYKADMQLLHGYQKRQWAKYCIIRIRLPSFYQLTGRHPDDAWSLQLSNQASPPSTHCPDFVPIVSRRAEASHSPECTNNTNIASDERSSGDAPPRFEAIRETRKSLFVKLANNESMPETLEISYYHRPLYLKFDPVSDQYGYWIGRNSYLANNHTQLK